MVEKWEFGRKNLLRMGREDVEYVLCADFREQQQLRSIVCMFNGSQEDGAVLFSCETVKEESKFEELGHVPANGESIIKVYARR